MFDFNTLPGLFKHIQENIKTPSYLNYRNGATFERVSSDEFVSRVIQLTNAFHKIGVKRGTTVAIISPSSPFWLMVDLALQRLGAVSVPIFTNIAPENLLYQVEDAGIAYLFAANIDVSEPLLQVIGRMKHVIVKETLIDLNNTAVTTWEEFLESGRSPAAPTVSVEPGDLATIIYTSGSTGEPKGVQLSHENLVIQLKDAQLAIPLYESDVALSLLPLAHIFERMVMLYYLACGTSVFFVDDVKKAGDYMKEVRPTVMVVVPRLLEKIYAKIHLEAERAPLIKRMVAAAAFWWTRLRDPDLSERGVIDALFSKLVYSKLLEAMGGNLRVMICGGAPLSRAIAKFFLNIGLPLYQGYGLTECSPVVSVNRIGRNRWGSSGEVFAHVEVKLSPESELMVRGKNVMLGYHNKAAESAAAVNVDGWLHTGDLAIIDSDGYITIVSRLKELYKTSTGKFVSTIRLESAMMHSKWIEYAMVVAEGRPFVTALLFVDPQMVPQDKKPDPIRFQKMIDKKIAVINKHFNPWERVRKTLLIYETPTIENGLLTPSMKLVRHKVYARYREEIEALYHEERDL